MKEQKVIELYILCNKLKNVIRTGWLDWSVKRVRLESIAEHVYGTQMLAIAMYKNYEYDLDIYKVIMMLAIHEIGETIIGDITCFDMNHEQKEKIEHEAIHKILNDIIDYQELENLILEFDKRESKEAKFAYMCDKLECDIQAKIYDEENCVDLNVQKSTNPTENKRVKELLNSGLSWGQMWISFDQEAILYDENFYSITEYIKDNYITKTK